MANRRVTQEEFIRRARAKHGDKYDYSKTVYNGMNEFLTIICPIHGEFQQLACVHLKHGCRKCAEEKRRLGRELFIKKAREIHGDKFDYSQVVYVHNKQKVLIKCNTCGRTFEKKPNAHLNGGGCPYCYGHKTRTTEEFIALAKAIHGDKFDYSQVNYVNNKTRILIKCNTCGKTFRQAPEQHLEGRGCTRCARNARIYLEDFIERAREVHGDKYDYSKVKFNNSEDNVTIICPKHGEFTQNIRVHLKGHGCWKCYGERSGEMRRMSQEEFLRRAKETHGDKYDYSESICKGANEKVRIRCNTCGRYFNQVAGNHVEGQGCPYCVMSKSEKRVRDYLESHNIPYEPHYFEYSEDAPLKLNRFNVDFYIEIKDGNQETPKRTIIECNGKQHYEAIGFFGGEEQFKWQKMRDNALREHCRKKGIKFIEIPYTEYDRIEEILEQELK